MQMVCMRGREELVDWRFESSCYLSELFSFALRTWCETWLRSSFNVIADDGVLKV
jgi:hypothetical protein